MNTKLNTGTSPDLGSRDIEKELGQEPVEEPVTGETQKSVIGDSQEKESSEDNTSQAANVAVPAAPAMEIESDRGSESVEPTEEPEFNAANVTDPVATSEYAKMLTDKINIQ